MIKNSQKKQGGVVVVLVLFFIGIFMLLLAGIGAAAIYKMAKGIPNGFQPAYASGSNSVAGFSGAGGDEDNLSLSFPVSGQAQEIGNCINSWFKNKRSDSPLVNKGSAFAAAGEKYNVNPALLIGIAGAESTYATDWGQISSSTHNYQSMSCGCSQGSVPCTSNGWEIFSSWEESIFYHAAYIQRKYLSQGIVGIREIGSIYCGEYKKYDCPGWLRNVPAVFSEVVNACPQLKDTLTAPRGKNIKLNQ